MQKIFQIKNGYIPAIILGLLIFGGAVYATVHNPCQGPGIFQNSHHDCYSANANGQSDTDFAKVTESAGNKCVDNNNSLDIFIPAKTSGEWTAFQAHAPNVILNDLNVSNGTCANSGGACNFGTTGFYNGSSDSKSNAIDQATGQVQTAVLASNLRDRRGIQTWNDVNLSAPNENVWGSLYPGHPNYYYYEASGNFTLGENQIQWYSSVEWNDIPGRQWSVTLSYTASGPCGPPFTP